MAFFGGHKLETPSQVPGVAQNNTAYFGESGQQLGTQQNDTSGQAAANHLKSIAAGLGFLAPIAGVVPGIGQAASIGLGSAAALAGIAGNAAQESANAQANDKYQQELAAHHALTDAAERAHNLAQSEQRKQQQEEYNKHQQAAYDADQQQKAGAHYELLDAINSLHTARQNLDRPQPLTMTASQPEPQSANPVPERRGKQIQNVGIKIKPRKQKTRVGKQKRK